MEKKGRKTPSLLLSFDIEEFDLPEEYGKHIYEEDKFEISRRGTEALLDLVDECGIPATFFVTGSFAKKYPHLIRRMAEKDHEIASHGMDHSSFQTSHLEESRLLLEEMSGKTVTGFRMARLAKVEKEEILKAGYVYESSLNPVWLPGRYNHFSAPLLPFREKCGLWQFPVSALPLIRFPLFWLSFKNLPLAVYEFLAGFAGKRTGYFNMYSHPWEYQEESADYRVPSYIVRHAGQEQLDRLRSLVLFLKKRGNFMTFQEFLSAGTGEKT